MNESGVAAGESYDFASDMDLATAWPDAGTLIRLAEPSLGPSTATAINARRQVVGWAAGLNHAMLWTLSAGTPVAGATPGRYGATLRPARRAPANGPASCLSDGSARASRTALAACILRRQ